MSDPALHTALGGMATRLQWDNSNGSALHASNMTLHFGAVRSCVNSSAPGAPPQWQVHPWVSPPAGGSACATDDTCAINGGSDMAMRRVRVSGAGGGGLVGGSCTPWRGALLTAQPHVNGTHELVRQAEEEGSGGTQAQAVWVLPL